MTKTDPGTNQKGYHLGRGESHKTRECVGPEPSVEKNEELNSDTFRGEVSARHHPAWKTGLQKMRF